MNRGEFIRRARAAMPIGCEFPNLGGGTTRIERHHADHVHYRRKNSTIRVDWDALYAAYVRFAGGRVSSTELREFRPEVFDSAARPAGHSCNCTFFMQLCMAMGLVNGDVDGRGIKGKPYAIRIQSRRERT